MQLNKFVPNWNNLFVDQLGRAVAAAPTAGTPFLSYSVTRCLYYFFNVRPFRPMKICQIVRKIYQSGFKFLPNSN